MAGAPAVSGTACRGPAVERDIAGVMAFDTASQRGVDGITGVAALRVDECAADGGIAAAEKASRELLQVLGVALSDADEGEAAGSKPHR